MNIIKDGKYVIKSSSATYDCIHTSTIDGGYDIAKVFTGISFLITLLPLECAPTYEWEA